MKLPWSISQIRIKQCMKQLIKNDLKSIDIIQSHMFKSYELHTRNPCDLIAIAKLNPLE